MQKTALLLGIKLQTLEDAQRLFENGYALYAESKTAHFLNQNMIPASVFLNQSNVKFDVVLQA